MRKIFTVNLMVFWMLVPFAADVQSKGTGTNAAILTASQQLYRSFGESALMPEFDVFTFAFSGHVSLREAGKLGSKEVMTVVDFRKPSNEKRLWVLDLAHRKVLFQSLVAHGRNTGNVFAETFSNEPNSNTSSIGFYVTGKTYTGKHGLSLYLDGQEKGYNDNARKRAIVMHGADYVSQDFVKRYGRLGRSLGCPSVPMEVHAEVINAIKDGTTFFLFYPEEDYLAKSGMLNANVSTSQLVRYMAPTPSGLTTDG